MNEQYAAVLADLEQMKVDAEDGIRAIKRLISRNGSPQQAATTRFVRHANSVSFGARIAP